MAANIQGNSNRQNDGRTKADTAIDIGLFYKGNRSRRAGNITGQIQTLTNASVEN
jgi:hypothetical protein